MKKETLVYDGFHKVYQVEANLKGKQVKREKVGLKSAVAGIVIDENNRIALVSQYRPVVNKQTFELPAGLQDKEGLTPVQVLIEELEEECEIHSSEIISVSETPIHEYYMVVGSSDARIELYEFRVKAQRDKKVKDADVDEVRWVTHKEMADLIKDGSISDGKTIIAYYYLASKI